MSRKDLLILSSDGSVDLAQIDWGAVAVGEASDPITLRVFNAETSGTATSCALFAGRSDMTILGYPSEDADAALENGDELAGESWVEARIDGDTVWTPINEYLAGLSLGTIAAQAHVSVNVRLNIPSGAETVGEIGFNLIARCI
jgi:hypothetical protein